MARLDAKYKHFWANGLTYRHIWQQSGASPNGNASGDTITVGVSLIAGLEQADAFLDGQTLTTTISVAAGTVGVDVEAQGDTVSVAASLVGGIASVGGDANGVTMTVNMFFTPGEYNRVDAGAPLNLRLNARYRHFFHRKRTHRHIWAQWEGKGISTSLADGQLVVSSLAVLESGTATGDANTDGDTVSANVTLIAGETSVTEPGDALDINVSLIDGAVSAEVNLEGNTLPVNVSLVQGWARFDTSTIVVTIIPGEIFVPPDALAIPRDIPVVFSTLFPGAAGSNANVIGADQTVNVELLAGTASVSVEADGDVLPVVVTINEPQPSAGALIEGVFDEKVTVTLIEGVATGGSEPEPPSTSARAGGPVGYHKKPETVRQDAQAFGAVFAVGYGIVAGKPHVDPVIEAPQPTPNTSPSHVQATDKPLPVSITQLLEVPEIGGTPAVQPEPVAVHTEPKPVSAKPFDWIAYDNELLELI